MQRRAFLKTLGMGAAALTVPGCAFGENLPSNVLKTRPNIIYIMADDLGYGDLGCYGQSKFKTPNLDRLAREGMRFTQHYTGSTVCAPSRCSLMTGLHTGHSYIRGNKEIQPEGQEPIPADTVTVAGLLQQAGYVTGMFGKWGLGGPGTEGAPNKQGFDYFYGYLCQREAHSYYPQHLWRNDEMVILEKNQDGKRETYSHDLIAQETLDFIRRNRNRPFFLYVPFTIPHAELAVPQDSLADYEDDFPEEPFEGGHYSGQATPHAAFVAMVTRMDQGVGAIMNALKEADIDDNTLVIFTSDNGPHQEGGHDPEFFNCNGPLRGIKRDVYEGGIRVPYIARWPSRIKAGTVSDHISAFWDFLPTCAELAGVKAPEGLDGISIIATLTGRSEEQKEHEYLYWEFHEQGGKQAVRAGDWKAVRLNVKKKPHGPLELYNLNNDIGETQNIAEKHPEIVARMEKYISEAHTISGIWKFPGIDKG